MQYLSDLSTNNVLCFHFIISDSGDDSGNEKFIKSK